MGIMSNLERSESKFDPRSIVEAGASADLEAGVLFKTEGVV